VVAILLLHAGEAPDFTLRSQQGTDVTLRQFRGKVVALAFIFASCSAIGIEASLLAGVSAYA
jgi:cytochrome oxidase Cu insertion factor (SCO1/SenC/PrrC family)